MMTKANGQLHQYTYGVEIKRRWSRIPLPMSLLTLVEIMGMVDAAWDDVPRQWGIWECQKH